MNKGFAPYTASFQARVEIVSPELLHNAEQQLADIPGGIEIAMKRAMNRATAHLRTQSTREIRKRYDIARKDIRAEQNITTSYRYFNGVEAKISFRGKKIPLWRYGGHLPANRPSTRKRPSWQSSTAICAGSSGHCRDRPSVSFDRADYVLSRICRADAVWSHRHLRAHRRQNCHRRCRDQGDHGFFCSADARWR